MKEIIASLIAKKTKLKKEEIESLIEVPKSIDLGDFAFPCFSLSKTLKKSPAIISQEIASSLQKSLPEEIEKIEVKNAYLNFFLNKKILCENAIKKIIKEDEDYGKSNEKHKIVIDFSSPNVGKPMHIGHIRSTILGDSLLRVFSHLGNEVFGINYLGDIGLHIGKLIVAWELWLDKKALKENPIEELLRLYVLFCEKEKTEYNEELEEEFQDNEWTNKAKEKLLLLEKGDEKTHKIWQEITKSSKVGFNKVYQLLNVNFHETTGQSFFEIAGKKVITEALKKGIAKIDETGAFFVEFENLPKKFILRKNGTASYITYDIGAAIERNKKYKFDKMIYITDSRQDLHFKQLFETLNKFGYDFYNKLSHVGFGTINFGNEIMATRKGKIILLEDVLKKTIEKAQEEISKRETKGNPEIIGVGAIKYVILKSEPVKNISFSWEQALNFEGNSAPYMQYSYARACSILKKSGKKPSLKFNSLEKQEVELIKALERFPEILKNTASSLNPAVLANYSFELSQLFNEFYHNCRVIESPEESQRIAIIQAFLIVLKSSLNLLGIEVMQEM